MNHIGTEKCRLLRSSTRRDIQEDDILQSHRLENLKSSNWSTLRKPQILYETINFRRARIRKVLLLGFYFKDPAMWPAPASELIGNRETQAIGNNPWPGDQLL
jgi:hypothetical protein